MAMERFLWRPCSVLGQQWLAQTGCVPDEFSESICTEGWYGEITNHVRQVIPKNAISHTVITMKCQGNEVFKWNSAQTESVWDSTTHLLLDVFLKLIMFSNWRESEINHHTDPVKIRWLLKDKPQSYLHLDTALLPIYFQINIDLQLFSYQRALYPSLSLNITDLARIENGA